MFKIKKQIDLLYLSSIIGGISITGAWVAILSARGFSLVQIGIAETVFHITSLCFEIHSGVFADIFGRKKMLVISNVMFIIGNVFMAFSSGFFGVCISFVFQALGWNFQSGSQDALAYDSLKTVNLEEQYEKYASNQLIIYRITSAVSTLGAGFSLILGYRNAYLISVFSNVSSLLFLLKLVEVRVEENNKMHNEIGKTILTQMVRHFKQSILFFINNKKASMLMFSNSLVGAIDTLLLFFLQSKIMENCTSKIYLGALLFIMQLGGIVGAKLILKVKKAKYIQVFLICTLGVVMGVLLEHSSILSVMTLGGFVSAISDDALQVRVNSKLQDDFPSEQRATLLSLSEFTFSVIMIILSPLAGLFFTVW